MKKMKNFSDKSKSWLKAETVHIHGRRHNKDISSPQISIAVIFVIKMPTQFLSELDKMFLKLIWEN